jgi:hypothetical protein
MPLGGARLRLRTDRDRGELEPGRVDPRRKQARDDPSLAHVPYGNRAPDDDDPRGLLNDVALVLKWTSCRNATVSENRRR